MGAQKLQRVIIFVADFDNLLIVLGFYRLFYYRNYKFIPVD